ncbi:TPA: ead/Ea22-like family protein [Escherichia coli]|uniref:ead/Ea22-like family protein n=3 Tax=Escherichia coli TaxID=562 RepID=UPI0025AA5F54|nr:ead/Ea22-like family protein [Escherichia coli]EJF3605081.1 ead/Ea22-like family protein [Escherichia coli]EJL8334420.1 ead/Ea22-like family protein [Escherichia coli]ELT9957312.1 ead/Ea22-like family protein [Escherichia coli]EME6418591.1 ead/Ea22-like family protein [Escherichia coli]
MSNINYQALREIAKQATQGEWCAFISPGKHGTYAVHTPGDNHHGDIVDWPGFDEQKNAENNARYIAAFNPVVVQALLDELEAKDKRIAELEAREVQLPAGYELRYGHPINADERHVMIPKENGSWIYLADLERALRVAGIRIKGE